MATIVADLPTAAVLTAFEANSVIAVRYVDIYQADNVTLWQGRVDIEDGQVSVDMTRAERRNVSVTLNDPDVVYGPGNLWYDKIIKPYRGVKLPDTLEPGYVRLPGIATNHIQITRSALSSVTAAEFAVRVTLNSIGVAQRLAGWAFAGGTLNLTSGNLLNVSIAKTISGVIGGANSSVAVPGLAAGTKIWLRGKVTVATAVCQYYYSIQDTNDYDAVTWTQIGTNVTGTNAAGAVDLTKTVGVIFGSDNTANAGFAGKLHAAAEAVSSAKTIEIDPSGLADGTTTWSAVTGQTVIVSTSGAGLVAAVVGPVTTPGDDWVTCLGEFMIDSIERAAFPSYQLGISGRDFTKKLDLAKFAATTTFALGQPVETIIKAISTNGGIAKFAWPGTLTNTTADFTFDRGSSRLEACNKLAEAYSYELFFDNFGQHTLRKFVDPLTAPLSYTFKTGSTGNLAQFSRSTTDSELFNDVLVYGDGPDNPLVFAQAQNTNVTSPTRIAAIGRRTWTYSSQFVPDNTAAAALAASFLSVLALEQYNLNMDSIVLPWLEAGDAVEAILPDSVVTDPTRFLLSSFDIPLTLSTMSATCKRITIVG